ncbi:hypothetical protein [Psychrobacillus sp. OK032]|uniref:hypothetical protein n=1 Tax=Psychrobacillus sp. OK032 TaxID=1884358 RepID=UPI0008AF7C6D|nr:hypothetical protein [Psychrobacillus sp. OK032]SER51705.1 hypothetical protein SAMN05518872_10119 [Psychrobacillus sp. OK032]
MLLFAEILRAFSIGVLVITSSFYLRYLVKTKKQRKLSTFENITYITIEVAYLLFAISLLISIFVD